MTWGPLNSRDLLVLAPFGILVLGALLIMVGSRKGDAPESRLPLSWATFGVILATINSLFLPEEGAISFGGLLIHDRLGIGFSVTILGLLAFALPAIPTSAQSQRATPSGVYSLLLLSAAGGMLMAFSNHLITFFIGLELLSLPLYVLVGLGPNSRASSEASFKYFLLGAIASSLFVYGTALVWGATGTLTISDLSAVFLNQGLNSSGLLLVGSVLVFTGIAFKLGLAPFQMWVPDVYEGAPSGVVAWMSGGVKAAAFAVALRLFGSAFPTTNQDWPTLLSWVAMISMVWGSLAALYQTNVKRLLAYSAIAHGGYALIAVVCSAEGAHDAAASSLIFYVVAYGLASLTAFVTLSIEEGPLPSRLTDLAGLAKRRPGLALALAISLLSLAGLPPLGGFVAKFNVFALAMREGHPELVLVGVVTSVISLAYYLRLIVQAYMSESTVTRPIVIRWGTRIALGATAGLTLLVGIFPARILDYFSAVGHFLLP